MGETYLSYKLASLNDV